jgi:hypothetical protein
MAFCYIWQTLKLGLERLYLFSQPFTLFSGASNS